MKKEKVAKDLISYLKENKKTIYTSILLIFTIFVLRLLPSEIPYLDKKGDEYFETATKEAVAVYAVARLTNALVSVAKETEMEISPFGVGVTVHIGQVLDPLDDATERLSTVLTTSIAILGLMKISKEILQICTFKLISYLLIFLLPGLWIKKLKNFSRTVLNIVVILLAVRLALPVCGVINDFLYKDYFKPNIDKSLSVFNTIKEYEKSLSPESLSLPDNFQQESNQEEGFSLNPFSKFSSFKDKFGSFLNTTKEKATELKTVIVHLWQHKGELVEALVNLIVVEVSMVFVQVIALPLTVVWILTKLINALFERKISFEDVVEGRIINKSSF
ncbi:MAG: hypothetical protein ABGX27_01660 [Desulfurobacteriaceae bacterium]